MGSFTQINNYAVLPVNFEDTREPGPRIFPPVPLNTVFEFDRPITEKFPIYMGTQVEQIIRPGDALLNLWINVNDSPGAVVTWENLPTGVGLADVGGGYYIVGPINTVNNWNQIKEGGRVQFTGEGPAVYKVSLEWFAEDEYKKAEWINGTLIPVALIRGQFTAVTDPSVIFAPRYDWLSEFVFYNLSGKLFTITQNLPTIASLSAVRSRIRGFTFARTAFFTVSKAIIGSIKQYSAATDITSLQQVIFTRIRPAQSQNTVLSAIETINTRLRLQSSNMSTATTIVTNADKTIFVPEMVASSTMQVDAIKTTDIVQDLAAVAQVNAAFTGNYLFRSQMLASTQLETDDNLAPMIIEAVAVTGNRTVAFHLSGTGTFTIDWGNGITQTLTRGNGSFTTVGTLVSYTYATNGTYTIYINSTAPFRFFYPNINHTQSTPSTVGVKRIIRWHALHPMINMDYACGLPTVTIDSKIDYVAPYYRSGITSTKGMFRSAKQFNNEFIIDMSQVTDASEMFYYAESFNQDINYWNTSSLTDMSFMFAYASAFNQPLNNWNTSNVTDMEGVFWNAVSFDQPLNTWDVSNVNTARIMFARANAFNSDLSNWNWASLSSAEAMFAGAESFNQNINTWNVSNITAMNSMFGRCTAFNQPLNNWNISAVTRMDSMFYQTSAFNQNITSWNTSNVTTTNRMFGEASAFDQPLDQWDTSNVTDMSFMFNGAQAFNQPLAAWDTSAVTNMSSMFKDTIAFNQPLAAWDTSAVTNMSSMFEGAQGFNYSLNGWNVSNVTNMSSMFKDTVAFNSAIDQWNLGVVSVDSMFFGAQAFNQPIGSWNMSGVTNTTSMFANTVAFNQPLTGWNTSNVTNMTSMFIGAQAFNSDISTWNTSSVTSMFTMFAGANAFNQPIGSWNVSNVTNMTGMFQNTPVFNQPLNAWNTQNVNSMLRMFRNAQAFNQPLSNWKTGKVARISMLEMFRDAVVFNQDLSTWDVNHILTEPQDFDTGAIAWTLPRPDWGPYLRANITSTATMGVTVL